VRSIAFDLQKRNRRLDSPFVSAALDGARHGGFRRRITLYQRKPAVAAGVRARSSMGQNVSETMSNFTSGLKDLAKFPVPPYLQKDFGAFKASAATLQTFLEKAADSDEVKKARDNFAKEKPAFDTAKTKLVGYKDKVNKAQPGQKTNLSSANGKVSDVNAAAAKVIDALKGKTGKEADLSKAVVSFANKVLTKVGQTDDPKMIDAEL